MKKILNLTSEPTDELTEDQKRKQHLEKQLKMLDMKDLTACNVRSEQQKAEDDEEDDKKKEKANSSDDGDDGFAGF